MATRRKAVLGGVLSLGELTQRDAVMKAIVEFDAIGRQAFLDKYGFGEARAFWLVYEGKKYDSKAIVGAAYGYEFPDRGALSAAEFSGGEGSVQGVLESLGFAVEVTITPGQISKRFRNLSVSTLSAGRSAPHKPLLALLALRGLVDGSPRLTATMTVAAELGELLRAALPDIASPSPWEPIWRMEPDLWELSDSDGDPRSRPGAAADPPVAELRQPRTLCGLTEQVHEVLSASPEWVRRIQDEIVDRYLAGVPIEVVARARGDLALTPRVWWVNQGQTYRQERAGGYLWAPTVTKNGRPVAHHTAVGSVRPGDVVVHYSGGSIKALGRVSIASQVVPRPAELPDDPWAAEGYRAGVEYFELASPIPLHEIADRPHGEGPFSSSGAVNQGYLYVIPDSWSAKLRAQFPNRWPTGSPWAISDAQSSRCVVVYVGQSSEDNFRHSFSDGRWGWKSDQKDYARITAGDQILFALGFTGGSPRVQPEVFATHTFRRLVRGRVTSAVRENSTPYWPDESTGVRYPYRLTFEVVEDEADVGIGNLDARFGVGVGDAFRLSALGAGKGVVVDTSEVVEIGKALALADVVHHFAADLKNSRVNYGSRHEELARTFVTSLATKRFVILTGLSGSGKTKIAQSFGSWLGPNRLQIIAVRPDWTNPDPLLGYENGLSELQSNGYAWNVPDALAFILRAIENPNEPHLLLLDEMNLAHVERYFADVLSGMETNHAMIPNLQRIAGEWRVADGGVPRLPMPANLFIVGTVNVDETTYMFSPKVLDRANTIEFRVATEDLQLADVGATSIATAPSLLAAEFLRAATRPSSSRPDVSQLGQHLQGLHRRLTGYGREFGHRTFSEAIRFAGLLSDAGDNDMMTALDLQVLQKVLPKYHGSIRELGEALNDLGAWCFFGPGSSASDKFDAVAPPDGTPALPRSFDKVNRMAKRLRANHFVSFAE